MKNKPLFKNFLALALIGLGALSNGEATAAPWDSFFFPEHKEACIERYARESTKSVRIRRTFDYACQSFFKLQDEDPNKANAAKCYLKSSDDIFSDESAQKIGFSCANKYKSQTFADGIARVATEND